LLTTFAGAWAVVKLEFKKDAVDYASLVEFFFRIHDASTIDRQGILHLAT
jgi:peptide methionine sulfoxide reductase MsrA